MRRATRRQQPVSTLPKPVGGSGLRLGRWTQPVLAAAMPYDGHAVREDHKFKSDVSPETRCVGCPMDIRGHPRPALSSFALAYARLCSRENRMPDQSEPSFEQLHRGWKRPFAAWRPAI
jgi:hypothetical protein